MIVVVVTVAVVTVVVQPVTVVTVVVQPVVGLTVVVVNFDIYINNTCSSCLLELPVQKGGLYSGYVYIDSLCISQKIPP